MSLAALKQQLADLVEVAPAGRPPLPTGIEALDRALSTGGVPRGRLTEIVGARGSGKTTLVRRLVEETVAGGGWVAYVDATRTLAPRDWAHLSRDEGVWMIRPPDPARGAWCADVLLRSGAFALVVLDAAPPLTRSIAVRLAGLARDASAALVVVADEEMRGVAIGSALRLRVRRAREDRRPPAIRSGGRERWREHDRAERSHRARSRRDRSAARVAIVVEKGGGHQTVEVSCAIDVARRLCAHPEVPDRRGVARRAPWAPWVPRGGATDGAGPGPSLSARPHAARSTQHAAQRVHPGSARSLG